MRCSIFQEFCVAKPTTSRRESVVFETKTTLTTFPIEGFGKCNHHRRREKVVGTSSRKEEDQETKASKRKRSSSSSSSSSSQSSAFKTASLVASSPALLMEFPERANSALETLDYQNTLNPAVSELSLDAFRLAAENPEAAAVIALAALIVVPKAIEQIGKKIVLPVGALFILYGALSHPDFVAGTAGWAVAHPKAIAFVAIGVLALQLSPFIIIALLLAVIFNISNVVPDELNPLFPKGVKENISEVKKDARIVREALAPVERSFSELENFKNEVQTQKQQARKARLAREERRKREEKEAREKPLKLARLEKKAAEEELERRRNAVEKAARRVGDVTRCVSLPTPEEKARCVDKNHRVSW